ncbi:MULTISPECIES: NYN domain-containing protein [Enterococcus]|uniref:DNA-binding protein n=2 Tax=Enterococcus TaxID=1350 RepID=A0A179EPN2_ENTTH|nr:MULTISPECIES: NYN domain-containing protein [Enterococcus]ASZ08545.1 DNA-binding protein [Enterococcus thailandicus]MBO0432620.1 NYN domain-containing protein [Enterococcus sp. DIV0660C]MBO0481234.1 NYN domain-containing protein [Enterococcus sp. MSG2901]MDA3965324.1 NYN domain-containing protein [Enterococcus thailandicus]MDA3974642.1 NYN domain-containing protein [Enterococcus thailandicus]
MKKQLLIVDGYNMIGSWPELVLLKKQDKMADAREALLHRLSNYAKFEGIEVIVVFDAQLVPGIQQNYKKYQLEVVFTKEDETADSYIERVAGTLNDRLTQVTVATSDLAEQWVVFSQGALRTSAYELYKTIKKTEETIAQENINMRFIDFRRNSPWNDEQLHKLSKKLDDLMKKDR